MKNQMLFLFLCLPVILSAQTQVTGSLPGNTIMDCGRKSLLDIHQQSVTVEEGDTLTIEPGVVIKSVEGSGGITVKGTLLANGTAVKPIIFTSEKDDSVGGDTNGDGNATTPQAGDWDDILIRENGVAHLDHCQF
jgi:hypothetical protein